MVLFMHYPLHRHSLPVFFSPTWSLEAEIWGGCLQSPGNFVFYLVFFGGGRWLGHPSRGSGVPPKQSRGLRLAACQARAFTHVALLLRVPLVAEGGHECEGAGLSQRHSGGASWRPEGGPQALQSRVGPRPVSVCPLEAGVSDVLVSPPPCSTCCVCSGSCSRWRRPCPGPAVHTQGPPFSCSSHLPWRTGRLWEM